jgi:hypothetical protein
MSIREVASLVGTLIAAAQGTKWGKLYFRKLEKEKCQALKISKGNFDDVMTIVRGKFDICWWLSAEKNIPQPMKNGEFAHTIFSDASNAGWGAHWNTKHTGGRWSADEQTAHINWLELKACWLALKTFVNNEKNVHILVRLDNTCAIAYINNQGGVIEKLNNLAFDLWEWCKIRNIWLTAKHIPGTENSLADRRSRVFKDNSEWSLHPDLFQMVVNFGGNPDVDLFASRLNYKVKKFISWEPDPLSFETDAFSVSWKDLGLSYMFPPFSVIGKALSKIKDDRAVALVVVPKWETQHWFPLLHELNTSGGEPLYLPMSKNSITLPFDENVTHPIWHRLNLVCYRLSGK